MKPLKWPKYLFTNKNKNQNTFEYSKMTKIHIKFSKWPKILSKLLQCYWNLRNSINNLKTFKMIKFLLKTSKTSIMTKTPFKISNIVKTPLKPLKWQKLPPPNHQNEHNIYTLKAPKWAQYTSKLWESSPNF